MPSEDTAPGLGRTLCVVFQHGGAISLTSIRLRPDVPVDEMTTVLLGEYPVELEAQPVQGQQAAITIQDPMRPLGPPLRSNNNSFASEADSSGEAHQPLADDDLGSSRELLIRSKPTKKRIAVLIVAALSLVVVPGLVLGVATKQIPWGIALSGAIATVVSFFAGL
ncbi:hypothetical protein LA080_012249 [Diaporthe eres]|nr:hypothetical protein LA080_012249 [Diaporthe eres]